MKFLPTLLALLLFPPMNSAAISIHDDEMSLVETARWLKENQVDTTWMVNYTLHFNKCHSVVQVGGEGNRNNNNRNNNNGQMSAAVYTQYIAEFSVCPQTSSGSYGYGTSSSCGSNCRKGGTYLVNLGDFAEQYIQGHQEEGNENNNNNNNNNFKVNEYMQCKAMENKNNNNNNNNNNYDNNYFTQ